MSSEEEDSQPGSSSEEDNSDSNSDSENSSGSESEASDAEDAPSDSDDDTPKEEPLLPMPTFERRKREPPNPEIPWISAIPLANELDEMQTRIKQLEFTRDEDVKALEEQLELAEAEAVEATAKVENELQAILKERETLIKERDSLSAKLRKLEREERTTAVSWRSKSGGGSESKTNVSRTSRR